MAVLWPAFLAASAVELLVFAFADPLDLHWLGHRLDMSRQSAYTVAFFAFWGIATGSGLLTALLLGGPSDRDEG
ncbi:MAG: hypothetical protein KGJ44_03430 [Betaproteobacteria bacterium]|nr:hypothetical protein [Betaproteobacteria bacterium]